MPTPEAKLPPSPAGEWDKGHFEAPPATEAFKKEFEGK
jgi:hypothetical protein